jgi:uncharacterized protein DUF6152
MAIAQGEIRPVATRRGTVASLSAAAALLIAGSLFSGASHAHHSPAAFDRSKEVYLEGTVTRFAYNNPHTYLTIEIVDDDGRHVSREIEVGPISTMQPLGLARDSLQVGERVRVRANPSRRGTGTVMGLDVTRADGRVLPLHISATSVRPASTVLASSIEGVWRPTVQAFESMFAVMPSWPMTELGRRKLAESRRANSTTHSDCVPAGAPMLMLYPVALSMTIDEKTVVFDIDWLGARRVVRLDAAHPVKLEPSLQGDSIGRWEGDVLVVDTVGFEPHAEGLGFGMPSSDRKHLVERFSLEPDRRHLRYEVTVEDSVHLTQPVRHVSQWEFSPDLQPSGVDCDLEVARRYLRE